MNWIHPIALLFVSFLFSGLESALLTVTHARVRSEARSGNNPRAARLNRLLRRRGELLITILIGNNIINIVAFTFVTLLLVRDLGGWGYPAAFLISLPVYIIWVELLPKLIFQHFPFRVLSRLVFVLEVLFRILTPVLWIGRLVTRRRWVGGVPRPEALEESRDVFREMTAAIQREGTLNEDEAALIREVLDFETVTVRDIMLPMQNVTAIPMEMPLDNLVQLARETDLDQFPVMSGSGDLVGLVRVFEVLNSDTEGKRVGDFVRRLLRTPPDERAILALQRLRRHRLEVSAVYNERGRPLGIVSSHDIVRAMMRAG